MPLFNLTAEQVEAVEAVLSTRLKAVPGPDLDLLFECVNDAYEAFNDSDTFDREEHAEYGARLESLRDFLRDV